MTLACLVGSLSVAAAAAGARYSVTPIVGPQNRPAYPLAISSNGKVAGILQVNGGSVFHGFVWDGSSVLELPALVPLEDQDTTHSRATGVNASGHVVGTSTVLPDGSERAFVYKNNVVSQIPVFEDAESQAWAINDAGTIVGTFGDPNSRHAFVLRADNVLIDLGPGVARGISQNGYVVGQTLDLAGNRVPFLFRDADNDGQNDPGELITLGTLGSLDGNSGYAVNDSGVVVGAVQDQGAIVHAAIWKSAQGAPQQGTQPLLINDDPTHSFASGINNAGTIVGTIGGYAFLYENGQWLNLDSFVSRAGNTNNPSWQFLSAAAINSAGQIAAEGIPHGTATVTGCRLSVGGTQPPPPTSTVQLKDFTASPTRFTLRNAMTYVDVRLTLTAKPKGTATIPIQLFYNGAPLTSFNIKVKGKSTATTKLQFNVENSSPGTLEARASYGGVEKSVTLTLDPPVPLALKSFTLPSKGKRGQKINASLTLNDVPLQPVEVQLELLDSNGAPYLYLGIPVTYKVTVSKEVTQAKLTIPKQVPAGAYQIRASYGGVSQVRTITVK